MRDAATACAAAWAPPFEQAELVAVVLGLDRRLVFGNDFFLRLVGRERKTVQGLDWFELFMPLDALAQRDRFHAWLDGSELPTPAVAELLTRQGQRRLMHWHPLPLHDTGGRRQALALLGIDITRQRASENRVRRLADFYRALCETTHVMTRSPDAQALYEQVCRVMVDAGRASMAWLGVVDGDRLHPVAWGGLAQRYTEGLEVRLDRGTRALAGPTAEAVVNDRHVVCNDFQNDPRTLHRRERGRQFDVRASGAFPIRAGGRVVAALSLYFEETGAFDGELVHLAEQIAASVGYGLEHLDHEAARRAAAHTADEVSVRFRRVFDALPFAASIHRLDAAGGAIEMVDVNAAGEALLGRPREQLVGRSMAALGVGWSLQDRRRLLRHVAAEGHVRAWPARLRGTDGQWQTLLLDVAPVDFGGEACLLALHRG